VGYTAHGVHCGERVWVFVVILTRSLFDSGRGAARHQPARRFQNENFWRIGFPSAGSVFVLRQLRLVEPHTGAVVPPSARMATQASRDLINEIAVRLHRMTKIAKERRGCTRSGSFAEIRALIR